MKPLTFCFSISLGLKQTTDDPWEEIDKVFKIGSDIKGNVLYILDKGIIFLLDNDFEGILPISKINDKDKELFVINKEFSLSVSQINKENRKIVLDYTLPKDQENSVEDIPAEEISAEDNPDNLQMDSDSESSSNNDENVD